MYSEIQCKFGRFLSYSSSSEDRLLLTFENEFVSIVIEKKDPLSYATIMFRRMEPRIIPYLKRMVHESDTCRLQNKRLSYDESLSLVKYLHDISIFTI